MPMRDRGGCLEGLFRLFLLTAAFDFLEDHFGFGRGCSCTGMGCGLIILLVFLALVCSTVTGIRWNQLSLNGLF
jgi:hypothetical protein